MVVTVFRSRLKPEAAQEYAQAKKRGLSSDAGVVEGLAIARMFGRVLRHPAHQLQERGAVT